MQSTFTQDCETIWPASADWEQKQATRDQVKQTIRDFLYSDETGLPESYSVDEITMKSDLIFGHFLTQQQHGLALAAG